MKPFLSEEVEFKELMLHLEILTEIPSKVDVQKMLSEMVTTVKKDADMEAIISWTNHQLYQVLCSNLEGNALGMVKSLNAEENKEINGILGWCKLAQDCSSMTAQRLQGLATKVYQPKRCKNYADVNAAIE